MDRTAGLRISRRALTPLGRRVNSGSSRVVSRAFSGGSGSEPRLSLDPMKGCERPTSPKRRRGPHLNKVYGMRFVTRAVFAAILIGVPDTVFATPAEAEAEAVVTPWAWLQVDLELSVQLLREGDLPAAGQLALQTHQALTAAGGTVALERGQDYVDQLHRELVEVLEAAGFRAPETHQD